MLLKRFEEPLSIQQNAIVIHSLHSGRSAQLTEAITYVKQSGIKIVELISIADLDNLPAQGALWKQRNIDLVIAAGGDGLVGGVITHIAEADLPLGILPLGTSNDIARSLAIPQALSEAVAVLVHGKPLAIDIGVAQPAQQTPHHSEQQMEQPHPQQVAPQKHGFFAHVLTAGINVQFARVATDATLRQRYGSLTYPYAALEVFKKHTALEMDLRFEGLQLQSLDKQAKHVQTTLSEDVTTLHCRAFLVAIINAPIFGGGFQLAVPGASINDRLLDIVVIEEFDIDRLANNLANFFHRPEQSTGWTIYDSRLRQADRTNIPGIHHMQARSVLISTNIDPQDLTLDGEVRGQTPALVGMAEQRLRVLVL